MDTLIPHIDNSLVLKKPVLYDSSVIDISWIAQDPQIGIDINSNTTTRITINPTGDFLKPCDSYLYVEGKVTMADGSTIRPIIRNIWPNIALQNNFFPFLYNTMTYTINDVEIENFTAPGQCTTMYHLLTTRRGFNGSDIGWELDTYDGCASYYEIPYNPIQAVTGTDIAATNEDVTTAQMKAFIKIPITRFNEVNEFAVLVDNLTDAEVNAIPDPITTASIVTVTNLIIRQLNYFMHAPDIPSITTQPSTIRRNTIVTWFNQHLITPLNKAVYKTTVNKNNYNIGFKKRKDLLFNPVGHVMPQNSAGNFSFGIPLSWIFNCCEQYKDVMYNCKHELRLNRTNETPSLLKMADDGYNYAIKLTLLRWYMPVISPSLEVQSNLLTEIDNGLTYDIAFMNKKMDYINFPINSSKFTYQITYSTGIERPRYIVVGFQTIDTAAAGANNKTCYNRAIFNGSNLNGANSLMIDLRNVILKVNGKEYQLHDYDNSFNENRIARWYQAYKNMKKSLNDDFREEDMISFFDYRNLYRLYCFDISKQTEQLVSVGISNVSLDFYFNSPDVPQTATTINTVYILSLFDRLIKMEAGGQRQFTLK